MAQIVVMLRAIRLGQKNIHLQADDVFLVVTEHPFASVIE
jgi:hypothetical protein